MLTVEEIYESMKTTYYEKTGYSINDSSDMAVRMYAAAAQICSLYAYNDWVKNQAFPQTATGESLDYHAQMRGLERQQGSKSEGIVTFYIESPVETDLSIPAGTVCYTNYGTRFLTTEDKTLPSGSTSVDVPCQCETEGESGNVGANTIAFMAVKPVGISGCINSDEFTGGRDPESDESLRDRVVRSYKTLPNGANEAYYEKEVLQIDGVAAVKVLPKNRGLGTVDIIVASDSGIPDEELLEKVQSVLDSKREICVDVSVKAPTSVNVEFAASIKTEDGYQYDTVAAEAENKIRDHFGGKLLGKTVLIAELADILYSVEGVYNYVISAPASDTVPGDTELPVLSSINITEMGV